MNVTRYDDSFEKRQDPWGRDYFWLTGGPPPRSSEHETDLSALAKGLITLTPLDYDLSRKSVLAEMEGWRFDFGDLPRTEPPQTRSEHHHATEHPPFAALATMAIVLAAGCGGDEWTKPATPEPKPVATAGTAAVGDHDGRHRGGGPRSESDQAQVGVGQKGREDGDSLAAPITVPIAALFSVKERIAFEILIPKAMQINLATTGHNPKTQENS